MCIFTYNGRHPVALNQERSDNRVYSGSYTLRVLR